MAAERKNQFMYGKALSYVDSVTRHGVFRERTNIKLDKEADVDPLSRGNTREAFLSLRFPLLGPNRQDANTYHRLKKRNKRRKRGKQQNEIMFDIRKSQTEKSASPPPVGFLPAITTDQAKFVSHSWEAQSDIYVRPKLVKNASHYQSLPEIRNLGLQKKKTASKTVKISPKDRVIFPSVHGYHSRSNSPTYKTLIGAKDYLNSVVDSITQQFNHMVSVDENLTVDEFYSKYVSFHGDYDDDDETAVETAAVDTADTGYLSLLQSRPSLELHIEKFELENRLQMLEYGGLGDETSTSMPSLFSVWVPREHVENKQHQRNSSPDVDGNLYTERTAESIHITRKASKSNVEGWGDVSKDKEFSELKLKMERKKSKETLEKRQTHHSNASGIVPPTRQLSRQSSQVKMSVTDTISANLDAVLARIEVLDDQIDVDSVGKALENIGGKSKMRRNIENEKEKISPEEEKKRKKLKILKEKIQKSRPMNVGNLMYEKHKAKAIHRMAQLSNLSAEEANDLFLTRDHKVLSQKFIDRYNDLAFGSDSSDEDP